MKQRVEDLKTEAFKASLKALNLSENKIQLTLDAPEDLSKHNFSFACSECGNVLCKHNNQDEKENLKNIAEHVTIHFEFDSKIVPFTVPSEAPKVEAPETTEVAAPKAEATETPKEDVSKKFRNEALFNKISSMLPSVQKKDKSGLNFKDIPEKKKKYLNREKGEALRGYDYVNWKMSLSSTIAINYPDVVEIFPSSEEVDSKKYILVEEFEIDSESKVHVEAEMNLNDFIRCEKELLIMMREMRL